MPNVTAVETPGERFAFFDVDETLVKFKSMFSFDAFWSDRVGVFAPLIGGMRHRRFKARIQRYVTQGRSREFINALYYSRFARRRQDRTAALVEKWFDVVKQAQGGIYIPATLEILRGHQHRGTKTVLVSGSFMELVAPIARELGVDHVLATRLEVVNNRYTGQIEAPQMIGAGKAFAVRTLLGERGADPTACWAYGDHVSDLPMLEEVGNPHIVSSDPAMVALAKERGWRVVDPNIYQSSSERGI